MCVCDPYVVVSIGAYLAARQNLFLIWTIVWYLHLLSITWSSAINFIYYLKGRKCSDMWFPKMWFRQLVLWELSRRVNYRYFFFFPPNWLGFQIKMKLLWPISQTNITAQSTVQSPNFPRLDILLNMIVFRKWCCKPVQLNFDGAIGHLLVQSAITASYAWDKTDQ